MKATLTLLLVAVFVAVFWTPPRMLAQAPDTVTIAATPAGNINTVISGDTLGNGQRNNINRVYKLTRGARYLYDATLHVNWPLRLIADTGSTKPPVIAPAILQDNSSPGDFVDISKGNATFKNLYFLGVRADQIRQGANVQAIAVLSDSIRLTVDNCVFDGWEWQALWLTGNHDNIFVTNCLFRNMQHPTAFFYGEGVRFDNGSSTDTVFIVNNTFFCLNGPADCPVAINLYNRFEHNTVFLTAVNPMNTFYPVNAIFKNNIYFGTLAVAQSNAEIAQYYYENEISPSSTISIDSNAALDATFNVTEAMRTASVRNNAYFWPNDMTDFWSSPLMDTLVDPVWMNVRTTGMFSDKTHYPDFVASGNVNADPGFPASVMGQVDSLITYARQYRTATLSSTSEWLFNPNHDLYGVAWPVPENLTYTNTALMHAGDDGYALGDLNWFPAQKATWTLTDVKTEKSVPEEFALSQNYPNPFNPSTTVNYQLPKQSHVTLKVYNVLGQVVQTLVDGMQNAGYKSIKWNASAVASGMYFYRLEATSTSDPTKSFTQVKKMLMIK
jgi:hypothetical protein